MIINAIIPDKKFQLWQRGASGRSLRQKFRDRYENICRLEDINELEVEGRDIFKFTRSYNTLWTTLGYVRFEPVKTRKHPANRHPMSTMARTQARFVEKLYPTQEEPDEVAMAPEVPKSPRTLHPQKNK